MGEGIHGGNGVAGRSTILSSSFTYSTFSKRGEKGADGAPSARLLDNTHGRAVNRADGWQERVSAKLYELDYAAATKQWGELDWVEGTNSYSGPFCHS